MRIGDLLWLPVKIVVAVVKVSAIPAGIGLLAWWLLPTTVATWVMIVMGLWVISALFLLRTKVSGHVRSLGRGPIHLRSGSDWF